MAPQELHGNEKETQKVVAMPVKNIVLKVFHSST